MSTADLVHNVPCLEVNGSFDHWAQQMVLLLEAKRLSKYITQPPGRTKPDSLNITDPDIEEKLESWVSKDAEA